MMFQCPLVLPQGRKPEVTVPGTGRSGEQALTKPVSLVRTRVIKPQGMKNNPVWD